MVITSLDEFWKSPKYTWPGLLMRVVRPLFVASTAVLLIKKIKVIDRLSRKSMPGKSARSDILR